MQILGRKVKVFGGGMKKVDFIVSRVRGLDVLDVGVVQHTLEAAALENWVHRHVAGAAKSYVGIDMADPTPLREQGFDVRQADAQNFDLGRTFDVVVAGDIIEHLHDVAGFFESVSRHLRPGGRLIITTPNPWFLVRVLQASRGQVYENPEHTAWYSLGTLEELIQRFGFRVVHAEYGSSEGFLYRLPILPDILRHTSVWIEAELAANDESASTARD